MTLCFETEYVLNLITRRSYFSLVNKLDNVMPRADRVRKELDTLLRLCSDREQPRLIEVERIDDYSIFICIPGQKSECDFVVWRYSLNLVPQLKIPTHDDLGREFIRLKSLHRSLDRFLIEAIKTLIRDRRTIDEIMTMYFSELPESLQLEVRKFLVTLKWISLQEDINYPPPRYLGSKYALAVYLLLEGGFELKDVRKIIRF